MSDQEVADNSTEFDDDETQQPATDTSTSSTGNAIDNTVNIPGKVAECVGEATGGHSEEQISKDAKGDKSESEKSENGKSGEGNHEDKHGDDTPEKGDEKTKEGIQGSVNQEEVEIKDETQVDGNADNGNEGTNAPSTTEEGQERNELYNETEDMKQEVQKQINVQTVVTQPEGKEPPANIQPEVGQQGDIATDVKSDDGQKRDKETDRRPGEGQLEDKESYEKLGAGQNGDKKVDGEPDSMNIRYQESDRKQAEKQLGDKDTVDKPGDEPKVVKESDEKIAEGQLGDKDSDDKPGDKPKVVKEPDGTLGDKHTDENSGDEPKLVKEPDGPLAEEQRRDKDTDVKPGDEPNVVTKPVWTLEEEQLGDKHTDEKSGDEPKVVKEPDGPLAEEQRGDNDTDVKPGDEPNVVNKPDGTLVEEQLGDKHTDEKSGDGPKVFKEPDGPLAEEQLGDKDTDVKPGDEPNVVKEPDATLAEEQLGHKDTDVKTGDEPKVVKEPDGTLAKEQLGDKDTDVKPGDEPNVVKQPDEPLGEGQQEHKETDGKPDARQNGNNEIDEDPDNVQNEDRQRGVGHPGARQLIEEEPSEEQHGMEQPVENKTGDGNSADETREDSKTACSETSTQYEKKQEDERQINNEPVIVEQETPKLTAEHQPNKSKYVGNKGESCVGDYNEDGHVIGAPRDDKPTDEDRHVQSGNVETGDAKQGGKSHDGRSTKENIESIKQRIKSLESENEALNKSLLERQVQLNEITDWKNKLMTKNFEIQRVRAEEQIRIGGLKAELKECEQRYRALENQKSELEGESKTRIHDLSKESIESKKQSQQLKEEAANSAKQFGTKIKDLQGKLDKQTKEAKSLKGQYDDSKKEGLELKKDIDRLNKSLQKRVADYEARLRTEQKAFQATNVACNEEIRKLNNQLNNQKAQAERRINDQYNKIQNMKSQIRELESDKNELYEEKQSLLLRLSKVAGANLTHNNPNIADLNDQNRPTKLAENFSELYDNEWTDAFESLNIDGDEKKVKTLLRILVGANRLCRETTHEHFTAIKKGLTRLKVRIMPQIKGTALQDSPRTDPATYDGNNVNNGETTVPPVSPSNIYVTNEMFCDCQSPDIDEHGTSGEVRVEIEDSEHDKTQQQGTNAVDNDQTDGLHHAKERPENDDSEGSENNQDPEIDPIQNTDANDKVKTHESEVDNGESEESEHDKTQQQGMNTNGQQDVNFDGDLPERFVNLDKGSERKDVEHEDDNRTETDESREKGSIEKETAREGNIECNVSENEKVHSSPVHETTQSGQGPPDTDGQINQVTPNGDGSSMHDQHGQLTADGSHNFTSVEGQQQDGAIKDEPNYNEATITELVNNSDVGTADGNITEKMDTIDNQMANTSEAMNADTTTNSDRESDVAAYCEREDQAVFAEQNNSNLSQEGDTNGEAIAVEVNSTRGGNVKDTSPNIECKDSSISVPFEGQASSLTSHDNQQSDICSGGNGNKEDNGPLEGTHKEEGTTNDETLPDKKEKGNDNDGMKSKQHTVDTIEDQTRFTEHTSGELSKCKKCGGIQRQTLSMEDGNVVQGSKAVGYDQTDDLHHANETSENGDAKGSENNQNPKIKPIQNTDANDKVKSVAIESDVDTGDPVEVVVKPTVKHVTFDYETLQNTQKVALLEMRKTVEVGLEKEILEVISEAILGEMQLDPANDDVVAYVKKCVSVCWAMCQHEPPVHIGFFDDQTSTLEMDTNVYKPYTKTGKSLDFVVWPPLYLHEDGPMLGKGVAQAK